MNIKIIVTTLLVSSVFFVILLFGLGTEISKEHKKWFLFPKTSLRNLNQNNFVNYHYPHNMLITAEPNSIFMTEGGDNQVFSILYFALVEKKRPDIDFFDQKGNVFPRLYGDFFKTGAADVQMIRELRDFQLFSTERPIYLTWKRPGIERLSIPGLRTLKQNILDQLPSNQRSAFNAQYNLSSTQNIRKTTHAMVSPSIYDMTLRSGGNLRDQDFKYLGPWYLKPLGLLYRVTPARYAVIDVLEILEGQGTRFTIKRYMQQFMEITVNDEELEGFLITLQDEGYLEEASAQTLTMLKPFRPLENLADKDYWDQYTIAYSNVANAPYWERLARDIYTSYAQLKRDMHFRYNQFYRTKTSIDSSDTQNNLDFFKKANEQEKMIETVLLETAPYVYDNNGFMYDVANLLKNNNDLIKAVPYFERASSNYYPLVQANLTAAEILLSEAYKKWDERTPLLDRAQSNIKAAIFNRRLYFQLKEPSRTDIDRDALIVQAKNLEQQANLLSNTSPQQLSEKKSAAITERSRKKVRDIAQLYMRLGRSYDAVDIYNELLAEDATTTHWYLDAISVIGPQDQSQALRILDQLEANYGTLTQAPKLWELDYTRGILIFQQTLAQYRTGASLEQLTDKLIESQERLELYISAATEFSANTNYRKRIIQAERTVQYIKNLTEATAPSN
ncbi:hypothetical protein COTS27_00091 [Spirochaetota bacterium]|nr:hypothetical protein COTS27_00091 [Spirochaetota bacterium]